MKIEEPLNLISLKADNVKVLRAVRISPDGERVFTIGGVNGAGKSTVIDCLRMSLMGAREIPKDPIRHGARHASIKTVLGRNGEPVLTIELDMSIANKPRLVLRDASGNPQASPQHILNELYEHVAFDPLEFSRFDKDKKAEIIMRLANLDFKDQDAREAVATEKRKVANRDLRDEDARFKGMPSHRGVPEKEISVADLVQQLQTANEHNATRSTAVKAVGTARGKLGAAQELVDTLERELAEAKTSATERASELKTAEDTLAALAPAKDVAELQAKATNAEETNRKVRENAARAKSDARIRDIELEAAKYDNELTKIEEERQDAIKAAKFPVPSLSYDTKLGLLLNGSQLEEASDGQKLSLSVAIAIALNPKLPLMLIKQGNLLDANAKRMIAQMAAEAGAQVLMEMVSEDGAGCSVFLEDGELREAPATAAE